MRMRRYLMALFVILWWVSISSAVIFGPGDIEWANAVEGTLYKGGTLTNGEYMVKAVQFASAVQGTKDLNGNIVPETDVDPSVLLEIYKNNVLIKEVVMTLQSGAYIDTDYEFKISATGFTPRNAKEWVFEFYKPWAKISLAMRGKPKLEVTVTTDKTTYTSYNDRIITAKIEIKNSGQAFAKNVDVNFDVGELKLQGGYISQLSPYYYKIEKGTTQSFEVMLIVPELLDQKSYNLSADAKDYDAKEVEYKSSGSTSITVSPQPSNIIISKGMKDRIYLNNTVLVTVRVENGGRYDVHDINIIDRMHEKFEPISNTTLQWFIPMLKPGEEWSRTYLIKPLEANLAGFTMPAATANFTVNNKLYNISSKATTLVVNGPKIILNKTVDKPVVNISEKVKVTVRFKNVGNIGTRIDVKDSLPDSVSLVSNSTSLVDELDKNTQKDFSYTIRMDTEGKVELPVAVANYTDVEYRGTIRAVKSSDRPNITVIDPSKVTPTPTETTGNASVSHTKQGTSASSTPDPAQLTPGFNIVLAIIVLIFTVVFRRR